MEERRISIPITGTKYGVFTFIAFVTFFLIMNALNLIQKAELHFGNYIFLAISIFLAINEVRHKIHKHRLNYLPALGLGTWITAVTALLFGIFVTVLTSVDTEVLTRLSPLIPFQTDVKPVTLGIVTFAETFMFGVVQTFIIMQYFKRNHDKQSETEEEAAEGHVFNTHAKQS